VSGKKVGKRVPVTPAMIEAGEAILVKWVEGSEWDYRKVIARLYRAMHAERPKSKSRSSQR
jgi:hypothetical protein